MRESLPEYLSVRAFLRGAVGQRPNAAALLKHVSPLSFEGLHRQTEGVVRALRLAGFGKTARIAIALPADPTYVEMLVSVMCGAIAVPANPESSLSEFESLFRSTRTAGLLTRSDVVPSAAEAARRLGIPVLEFASAFEEGGHRFIAYPEPDHLAVVFTTSGTTAAPKILPLTHRKLMHWAKHLEGQPGFTPADRWLNLMPPYHSAGLLRVLRALYAGAAVAQPGPVAVEQFDECLAKYAPTWVAAPPPFVQQLLDRPSAWHPERHPSLRGFYGGGGLPSAGGVEEFQRKFGLDLRNVYGCAECSTIAIPPLGVSKPGSVGRAASAEIAIFDSAGVDCRAGEPGEIAVRGPGVFDGYETPQGLDRSGFRGDWFLTGDLGYLDSEGYLFLHGRVKEMIDRGGQKISPEEVEAVLKSHPQVRDAVVFAMRHPLYGQDVAALIVAPERVDLAAVREFAATKLAWYKVPKTILVVDAIPSSPTGKVPRARLGEMYASELEKAAVERKTAFAPPRTPVEVSIAIAWKELLGVELVGLHDRFSDLGGDSLAAVTMLAAVGRKLQCEIPVSELWRSPTVARLAAFVDGNLGERPSLLFPVQTSGSLPPLFTVQPGYFPELEHLARHLPDQPSYAIIPDPREGGAQYGKSADEVVEECLAAMRRVQPAGPYYLMGRSVGAVLAMELALRLQAAGERVAFLGMIDSHYPGVALPSSMSAAVQLAQRFGAELLELPRPEWRRHLLALPARALRSGFRRKSPHSDKLRDETAMITGIHRLFHSVSGRFSGGITMFAAEESTHRGFLDSRIFWSRAATEGLEFHLLPGGHNKMVQEPLLAGFAKTLEACLARARRDAAAGS